MGEEDFLRPQARNATCRAATTCAADESRPLRADAQRNRARLLEAAEAVFAAEGISVPVDLIAEKAGVGVGTLVPPLPDQGEAVRGDPHRPHRRASPTMPGPGSTSDDPGAAFFDFLAHLVEESTLQARPDPGPARRGGGDRDWRWLESKQNLEEAVSRAPRRWRRRAGAVRERCLVERRALSGRRHLHRRRPSHRQRACPRRSSPSSATASGRSPRHPWRARRVKAAVYRRDGCPGCLQLRGRARPVRRGH